MQIHDALRRARTYQDVKQTELALALNTSQSQISMYERGTRVMRVDFLIDTCKYLNLSADFVLGLSDDPKPYPDK